MSHSQNSQHNSGALPFAPTLRKAIILMVVGFATPILILLALTHFVNTSNPTPAASVPAQAAVASTAASAAKPAASAAK